MIEACKPPAVGAVTHLALRAHRATVGIEVALGAPSARARLTRTMAVTARESVVPAGQREACFVVRKVHAASAGEGHAVCQLVAGFAVRAQIGVVTSFMTDSAIRWVGSRLDCGSPLGTVTGIALLAFVRTLERETSDGMREVRYGSERKRVMTLGAVVAELPGVSIHVAIGTGRRQGLQASLDMALLAVDLGMRALERQPRFTVTGDIEGRRFPGRSRVTARTLHANRTVVGVGVAFDTVTHARAFAVLRRKEANGDGRACSRLRVESDQPKVSPVELQACLPLGNASMTFRARDALVLATQGKSGRRVVELRFVEAVGAVARCAVSEVAMGSNARLRMAALAVVRRGAEVREIAVAAITADHEMTSLELEGRIAIVLKVPLLLPRGREVTLTALS